MMRLTKGLGLFLSLFLITLLCGCEGKDSEFIDSFEDIDGKEIAVIGGTPAEWKARLYFPESEITDIESVPYLFTFLNGGKCDLVLSDITTAESYVKKYSGLAVAFNDVFTEDFSFGFADNLERLRFNAFLDSIQKTGELYKVNKLWTGDNKEEARSVVFPDSLSNSKKVIRVGTPGTNDVFSFVKNGQYEGMDIDIVKRYAISRGVGLDFIMIPNSALAEALASGKVDIVTGNIAKTPERESKIFMSDPYFHIPTAIVAQKKNISPELLLANTNSGQKKSFFASLSDDFHNNIIKERRYKLIIHGLLITLLISLMSEVFGTLLGCLLCYMNLSGSKLMKGISETYITIIQGLPQLVLLMLLYYIVFASSSLNGVIVSIIAFSMNFSAYVSVNLQSSILSIDVGQRQAALAMGFSRFQTFRYIVLPQAVNRALPVFKGQMVSLIKATSIVGYIAVEDLTKVMDVIRSRSFDAFFPLIFMSVIYFLLSWGLSAIINYAEIKTDPKRIKRNDQN